MLGYFGSRAGKVSIGRTRTYSWRRRWHGLEHVTSPAPSFHRSVHHVTLSILVRSLR